LRVGNGELEALIWPAPELPKLFDGLPIYDLVSGVDAGLLLRLTV
jgi:hypothetical protein